MAWLSVPEKRMFVAKPSEHVVISTHRLPTWAGICEVMKSILPSSDITATCPPCVLPPSNGKFSACQVSLFHFQRASNAAHSLFFKCISTSCVLGAVPEPERSMLSEEDQIPALGELTLTWRRQNVH